MSDLQGVLLCAGSGTRMTTIKCGVPKCRLRIVGVPMFIYPLYTMLRAGVNDVVIFLRDNYKSDIEKDIAKFEVLENYPDAKISYVSVGVNQEDYGTAELLRHYHSSITKDVLIMSCDFVSDSSLLPMIDMYRAESASFVALINDTCAYTAAPGPKSKPAKDLIAIDDKSGRLAFLCVDEDFEDVLSMEKISIMFPKVSLTAQYTDCHVYLLRYSTFQILSKHKDHCSFKADFVKYLIDQQFVENSNISCFAYRLPHENGCVTAHTNTIGSYFEVNKAILKSFARLFPKQGEGKVFNFKTDRISSIDSRVESNTNVGLKSSFKRCIIEENCDIKEAVKVKESVILKDVKIGNGSSITNSIICEGAEIGENVDINNCIVAKGQKVASKTKIKNEIIEEEKEWDW